MKEQIEPRSATKSSNVWHSPFRKEKKKLWNFKPARERGQLAELPTKIKPISFGSKIYVWGQYRGTLEDIKDFARIKGFPMLQNGAIKYKIA